MEHNVCGIDKVIRIVLGIAIIVCGIYFKSWWGLIGILPLLTGLMGFCLVYKILGINTCKIK